MIKIQRALLISLSVLSVNAAVFAASAPVVNKQTSMSGWERLYLLGQLGWGNANINSINFNLPDEAATTSNHDNDGLAGRAAIGYSILPSYLDVQLGYTKYHNATANRHITTEYVDVSDKMSNELYTADLSLVGKLPIKQFYLYAKAGEAYTHIHTNVDTNISSEYLSESITGDYSNHAYRPLLGVGAGYNINQHVFAEAGYQYIFGKESLGDNDYIPDLQFASLGLGVRF